MRLNCWESKKCGREPGGVKTIELGICPAANNQKFHGIHGGKNGGRACWVLAGTLCGGKVQGTFAAKLSACMRCEFYRRVKHEEGSNFLPASKLMQN